MVTFKVKSVAEIREHFQDVPWDVEAKFRVRKSTPLADAHDIMGLVRVVGGHGALLNPDVLLHKEDALEFVDRKITHLRRWKAYTDRKLTKLDARLGALKAVVEAGGPGVRSSYEPSQFKGISPYLDLDQVVDAKDMPAHVSQIRAVVLEASPASPAAEGSESANAAVRREVAEQLDIARFNMAYLEVKREGVAMLSSHLEAGINELQDTFVRKPTRLGAESADFVRFEEVLTHPDETVRKVVSD